MKTGKRMTWMVMAAIVLAGGRAWAGNLTPPGAPGATMHTLTEIYEVVDGLQQQVTDMQQELNAMKLRQGASGMAETVGGMVLIPAGTFQMGDAFSEGSSAELPVHEVTVSAFHMDQYAVTKAMWDDVRTWGIDNGYTDLPEGGGKGPSHPVHTVNWYDCVKWANARSQRDGLTPVYGYFIIIEKRLVWQVYRTGESVNIVFGGGNGYRLPTEAEWEKAARGGVEGRRFPWADGNTIAHTRANYSADPSNRDYDVSATAGYHPDYSGGSTPFTSPVGSFAPNGYGLYDMAGNVWEWCWDRYLNTYYEVSPSTDPRGPASGSSRVRRGGSWYICGPSGCRVAVRGSYAPGEVDYFLGFRLVRTVH